MQEKLKQQVQSAQDHLGEHMTASKSDRQKLLIDVAMKFLDQPPEKIE